MAEWSTYTTNKYEFKSKVEKQASDIFSDAITQDEEESYTPQLRGSSLPICILLHSIAILEPHTRKQDARLEHYAIQGTVFHEWYQKKLMYSKRWGKYVFGDFECPKCETVYYKNCCRPDDYQTHVCSGCGHTGLRYRELEGKYKGYIGVHVDMVLKFPKKTWIWEFKTSDSYKIKDSAFKFKHKHFHQASAYPLVIENVFGFLPERYFILYVNRDSPQFSKTAQRQHRIFPFKTNSEITKKRKQQLDKIVEGEKARIKYFKNPTIKNLKKLDSLRPCRSKEEYFEPLIGMKEKYEKNDDCPFAVDKKCGCFQNEKLSIAAKTLHKMIKDKYNETM